MNLIADAKRGDKAKFAADDAKWKANANEIADFLSSKNPNWPQAPLRDLMAKHLSTTTDELNARLAQRYDADVEAFDAVYNHILRMADAFSTGLIRQFPNQFA